MKTTVKEGKNMEKILVIAPHADDETLGCGGTLLKFIADGVKVDWLICSNFYRYGKKPENIAKRDEEIQNVFQAFGFNKLHKLNYDAANIHFSDLKDIVAAMSQILNKVKPTQVFLPNRSDVHTDHQLIFKAAYSSTKNFNFQFIRRILMYETPSQTEFAPALGENAFTPNVFIDVTKHFQKKLEIMKIYESELMETFYPRDLSTIKALGRFRGSSIGKQYAEAFMLLKEIVV